MGSVSDARSHSASGVTQAMLSPGFRLGRYELLLPLARGGMAEVWAARQLGDLGFSTVVAVKTIRSDMADDPSFRRMFLDEARIASRIRHANVVSVIDLGEQGSIVYQVMQLVDGDSLRGLQKRWRERVEGQPFPVDVGLRIVIDLLAGLHAAHELTNDDGTPLEVVHRDVSPHNVMVGVDGVARIGDFGIAKAMGRLTDETQPSQIKGKFGYMTPEQLARGVIDRRTDVCAAGIVLWEILTGKRLFRGDDAADTIVQVAEWNVEDPARDGVPKALADVAMKALARTPGARFADAAEMAGALEHAARDVGGVASQRAVSELVRKLMGSEIDHRKKSLASVLGRPVTPGAMDSGAQQSIGDAPTVLDRVQPTPKARRTPVLAIAAVVAALVVVVALSVTRRGPTTPTAAERPVQTGPSPTGTVASPAVPIPNEGPSAAIEPPMPEPIGDAGTAARRPAKSPNTKPTRPAPAASQPSPERAAPPFGNPYGQ